MCHYVWNVVIVFFSGHIVWMCKVQTRSMFMCNLISRATETRFLKWSQINNQMVMSNTLGFVASASQWLFVLQYYWAIWKVMIWQQILGQDPPPPTPNKVTGGQHDFERELFSGVPRALCLVLTSNDFHKYN